MILEALGGVGSTAREARGLAGISFGLRVDKGTSRRPAALSDSALATMRS